VHSGRLAPAGAASPTIRAITIDFWDTLYLGAESPQRMSLRRSALSRMVAATGHTVDPDALDRAYADSGEVAERWWRDEQRGYSAEQRIRWMLGRLSIDRPAGCEHIARCVQRVDDVLLEIPPSLVNGAADAVRALARTFRLAIVSDTGFASGQAQNRLLERDGLLAHFDATIYSADVGHAKPRAEMFHAALRALGVAPAEVIHVGDLERTDVAGALAAGMRAIRLDALRRQGPSAAEVVAGDWADVVRHMADGQGTRAERG
jgi:putative hydrolase of the HAD superfamily